MSTASSSQADDAFPDIRDAFRATWLAASQQLRSAEQTLRAAERSVDAAQTKLDEVRRQIEAACPPLGLDPAAVMAEEDMAARAARPARIPHVEAGPRAHFEERVTDLLADGRLMAGEALRTVHHGQERMGKVEADGSIAVAGLGTHPTLTAAARALVGGERNGWKFWSVQRDGRWVPVANLRNS
jgi:hypothetical protein